MAKRNQGPKKLMRQLIKRREEQMLCKCICPNRYCLVYLPLIKSCFINFNLIGTCYLYCRRNGLPNACDVLSFSFLLLWPCFTCFPFCSISWNLLPWYLKKMYFPISLHHTKEVGFQGRIHGNVCPSTSPMPTIHHIGDWLSHLGQGEPYRKSPSFQWRPSPLPLTRHIMNQFWKASDVLSFSSRNNEHLGYWRANGL